MIHRVRAVLFDGDDRIVLLRRTKPGRPPYWAAPGGRVEPADADLETALEREIREELAAEIEIAGPLFALEAPEAGVRQRFYRCRLTRRLDAQPTAPEYSDPARGGYLEVSVPLKADALRVLNIVPVELKDYLLGHVERRGDSALPAPLGNGVVTLDSFTLADVDAIVAGDRDAEHRRWFDFARDTTPQIARAAVLLWEEDARRGRRFAFAVRDAETRALLGGCELRLRAEGRANISYWTYREHRGRGIATQAVRLVCEYAARELRIARVQLMTDVENAASRAVARKAGFVEEGVLRSFGTLAGERRDMVLYARLMGDAQGS